MEASSLIVTDHIILVTRVFKGEDQLNSQASHDLVLLPLR